MSLSHKLDTDRKVIITVAPVGAWPTREMNPHLPITPEEIASEVCRSYSAGASVAHIHARELHTEKPTSDPELYRTILEAVRKRCPDIIIQLSTGAGAALVDLSFEQRIAHVQELRPEMASLNAGSLNMQRNLFANPPHMIEQYAGIMAELKIKPEFEIYDMGMIDNVDRLVREPGIIPEPHAYGLVLGVLGGIAPTVKNLVHMVDALPENCHWQVIAISRHQIPLGTVGLVMGGGIRVGFEDNIYLNRGVLATSNAQLVEKAVTITQEIGRSVASPDEARQILHLSS
jgi:3-keto-5-aminohexanoate cleavage enzyme